LNKTIVFNNVEPVTLTLTKNVTGNGGNKFKKFSFTVGIKKPGESDFTNSTIKLSDSNTEAFNNLPLNTEYKITEEDYSNAGYKTTITGSDESNGLVATGIIDSHNKQDVVVYENNNEFPVPTGLYFGGGNPTMNFTVILLVITVQLLLAVLAFYFSRRRAGRYER